LDFRLSASTGLFSRGNNHYPANKQYAAQVGWPVYCFLPVSRYLYRACINYFFLFGVGKARPDDHNGANYDEYDSDGPVRADALKI
jgi:hypothetical protein